jgi:hypothetical protein
MRFLILGVLVLTASAAPALAESRGYTITSFDKIRVAGPFTVNLRTGASPSARAEGSPRALDQVRVEVQGRTLVVSADRNGWGGMPGENGGPVVLNVSTPDVQAAMLTGSGKLNVDRAKSARFDLWLTGTGEIAIGSLAAERLWVTITGSGKVTIAGKAAQVRAIVQGAGQVSGARLVADDLDLAVNGAGDVSLAATRSAKVTASGSGNVMVAGNASCMVHANGSGEVRCGKGG